MLYAGNPNQLNITKKFLNNLIALFENFIEKQDKYLMDDLVKNNTIQIKKLLKNKNI